MGQQFCLDLKQILNEDAAKMAAQILVDSIVQDNLLKKQIGKDFLNKCLRNFQDQRAPAELKFYTLCIFRYFDSKEKSVLKIFSLLSGHQLFTYLTETALAVDSRKSVGEKGKNLFPDNKQMGVKFMRLLLESLKLWSERFPQNSNKQPTKYKKVVTKLMQQKVNFPQTYMFYGSSQQKQIKTPGNPQKNPKQREVEKVQKAQKIESKPPKKNQVQQSGASQQDKQLSREIMFLYNKIDLFIGIIQDEEQQNIDQLQREITKNHQLFQKQQKRLQSSNVVSLQDQKALALYFKLNQFFVTQKKVYQQQIMANDDLKMYCDSILLEFDRIFQEQQTGQNRKSQKPRGQSEKPRGQSSISNNKAENKNQQKKDKYTSQNNNSALSNKQNQKEEKKSYQSTNMQKNRMTQKDRQEDEDQSPNNNKKPSKSTVQIKDKVLRSFFDSHLQRPANRSVSGFKAIKESLQKQKKQMKVNPVRGRSPHNVSSLSRSKFDASTVSKIKTNSIFAKPPNPNVGQKKYDGTFVYNCHELEDILLELNKQQGMRRFKTSHLKNRAPLFENQHIQIGYKNECIYDQVEQFTQIIQFELFIGNKCSIEISNLNIVFQGDQKSLVYSNPQKVQQSIKPGEQAKMDVVVIPRHQVYSLINMKISYKAQTQKIQKSCILPSSILKFTTYEKCDSRQIRDYDMSANMRYQSQKFNLSHYFPPRKIAHYIEELTELSDYTEFAANGSEKDFVLGAFLTIKDKHECLLLINIRPDLSVVLQLKSDDQHQQAQKQFRLYLQTLEMILKQTR